jgi:hypothetical protein
MGVSAHDIGKGGENNEEKVLEEDVITVCKGCITTTCRPVVYVPLVLTHSTPPHTNTQHASDAPDGHTIVQLFQLQEKPGIAHAQWDVCSGMLYSPS